MGLGKTIQTIAFLVKQYEVEKIKKPSLIICPTSLVFNWIDEFQKFAPSIRVDSITSSKTGFSTVAKNTQVIIISYGLLGFITEEMADKSFYAVILDEAQNIKNAKTKRSKNLSTIQSEFRLALSGTPIENNLMELWSIFHFLMPGFLGNETSFKSRYIGAEKEVMQRLSAKIRPFILRRTKEQVMKELPPKIEETIFLDMEPEQARFYESLKIAYRERIFKQVETEGFQKSQFAILEALLRLRQACLTPALISDNLETHPTSSIKLTYLEENIEEIISSGHSVLIFSQFPSFLAFVRDILDEKQISYNYLDGGTKNRKDLVNSFNAGETKVFLISLKA